MPRGRTAPRGMRPHASSCRAIAANLSCSDRRYSLSSRPASLCANRNGSCRCWHPARPADLHSILDLRRSDEIHGISWVARRVDGRAPHVIVGHRGDPLSSGGRRPSHGWRFRSAAAILVPARETRRGTPRPLMVERPGVVHAVLFMNGSRVPGWERGLLTVPRDMFAALVCLAIVPDNRGRDVRWTTNRSGQGRRTETYDLAAQSDPVDRALSCC